MSANTATPTVLESCRIPVSRILAMALAFMFLPLQLAVAGDVVNPGNGHSYEVIIDELTWVEASDAAAAMSNANFFCHLATITSQAEHDFVLPLLPIGGDEEGDGWLGGQQTSNLDCPAGDNVPGNWGTWVTGETWSFTNWGAGEPDDCDEQCLGYDDGGNGEWENGQCDGDTTDSYLVECEPRRATFKVYKHFNDGNPNEVIVHLDCDNGLIPDQDQNPSDGHPIEFVVTDFDSGELNCQITETVPIGYSATYYNNLNGPSQVSCAYGGAHGFPVIIGGDAFTCDIENELIPVVFDVQKVWFDEKPNFKNPTYARARYYCSDEGQIECGGGKGFVECDDFAQYYGNMLQFTDNPDSDNFTVYPHWNGKTTCSVDEKIHDSSVESDVSDCQKVPVLLGQDVVPALNQGYECTIYNTRIYEGVPTLNQYGLALLALLMVGVGLVGFRRFV